MVNSWGMEALRAAGKHVPEDVAIIGFDNIDLGTYCSPPLAAGGIKRLVEK